MMYPKNYIKPKRKALKTKPRLKSADTRSIRNLGKPVLNVGEAIPWSTIPLRHPMLRSASSVRLTA